MTDSPRPNDAGLFLILPIPGKTKDMQTLYARISAITVYSAPEPTRSRVVVYQVTFWTESPIELPEGTVGRLWEKDGVDTFYYNTETQVFGLESLESGCIRDFLTYEVPEKKKPYLVNPIEKLYTPQVEGRCWDIYVKELESPLKTIVSLKHIETYTCTNNAALALETTVVKYAALDADEGTVELPYEKWENEFYKLQSQPHTFVRRWAKRRIIQ